MFYPAKVAFFILILLAIQFLTFLLCLNYTGDDDKVSDKVFGIAITCWLILLILAIAVGIVAEATDNERVMEEPFETTETFQVEHISNGNVFFYDETDKLLEVISISDDTLEIVLQEIDSQLPYVEKITTWQTYSKMYEKEKNIYDDMSTCSERYVVYVSKSDLYK